MTTDKIRSEVEATEKSRVDKAKAAVGEAVGTVKRSAGEGYAATRSTMSSVYHTAVEKTEAVYEAAKDKSGSAYEAAKDKAGNAYATAKDQTADAYGSAKEKTATAYDAARGRTGKAYSSAREAANDARERTAEGIEQNPLIALAGGIALGAIFGALIPRSRREIEALAPVGERIRIAAETASKAAKVAAFDKIAELGLSKADLVAKAKIVMSEAASAAKDTGTDAADLPKKRRRS